jgi:hypothetical protein
VAGGNGDSVMIRNSVSLCTVRTALRVTPLYVAEMVAVPTADDRIVTGNAPVELNPGTVTLAGTVATLVLLLLRETVAPSGAVFVVKKRVAEEKVDPVCTRDGVREIESSWPPGCGGGGAVTVSAAVLVTPA